MTDARKLAVDFKVILESRALCRRAELQKSSKAREQFAGAKILARWGGRRSLSDPQQHSTQRLTRLGERANRPRWLWKL